MSGKTGPPPKKRTARPVLPGAPRRFGGPRLTRAQRRNRWLVGAATIGAHVAVFTALFWHYASPPRPPEPATIELSLIDTPKPTPPLPPALDPLDTGATVVVPDPKPPTIHLTAQSRTQVTTVDDMSDVLSDAQVAGAATVGEGGDSGGACDMGQLVQRALRRDPLVRNAVAERQPPGQGHHAVERRLGAHRRARTARACRRCAKRSCGKWPLRRKPAATSRCMAWCCCRWRTAARASRSASGDVALVGSAGCAEERRRFSNQRRREKHQGPAREIGRGP